MRGQRPGTLPAEVCAVIGVNLRVLRQRRGWSQAELGRRMGGWVHSTVCAAEGRRAGRYGGPQRLFTAREVNQLALVLGVTPAELMMPCPRCGGRPAAGFQCLACGDRGERVTSCAACAGAPPAGYACLSCGAEGGEAT